MSENSDLFNNPAMKEQFASLPPEEQQAYKKAGEYMYSKDYTSETSAVDDAIQYIKNAFDAGMMPSQLTNDELEFLRNVYGDEWYTQFGFPSGTYTGIEKKTTKRKQQSRPAPIKMPVVKPIIKANPKASQQKSTVGELTSLDIIEETKDENDTEDESQKTDELPSEEIPNEELEINRQISWVYTVWS